MKESQHRYLGLASILLVGAAAFAACGGLDPRKVTKDPFQPSVGGDTAMTEAGDGPGPSGGGSESGGGAPGNPFGGQLFVGGAPPVLDGPPEVVQVDPLDMAAEVDVDINVGLLFSEAINPATITDDSVQLLDRGDVVSATASLEANELVSTIEPSRRLALAASYDVNVSTAVTDSTGTALASAFSSRFTTRDGTWDQPNLPFVDDPATNWYSYGEAFLDIDGRGNALVAWPQYVPNSGQQVMGRWRRQSTGFQEIAQLSNSPNSTGYPSVAVDESGDAVVVWSEYNYVTAAYDLMARRYVNGAWSVSPEPLTGNLVMTNLNAGPYVKMRGGHIVVWWVYPYYSGNLTYYYVYGTSAANGGAWVENPVYIGSSSSSEAIYSAVANMDPSGNAMLLFTVVDNNTSAAVLNYTKYVAATQAWENAAPVTGGTTMLYYDWPSIALDDNGAAMVAWRTANAPYDLVATRYTKAKGFANPEPLDDLDTYLDIHLHDALATDGTDFFITWAQLVGSTNNVYGTRYSTSGGVWADAALVSDGDTGAYGAPSTSADRHGNAMALWLQTSGTYQFRYSRYLAASAAWGAGQSMPAAPAYNAYASHSMATADNGIIAALIYHGDYSGENPHQPFLSIFQ